MPERLLGPYAEYIGATLLAVITSFLGWLFGRRSENAEAALNEMKATREAIEIWRNTTVRLQEDISEIKGELERVSKKLYESEERNRHLTKANHQLELEIMKLKRKIAKLTRQI